MRKISIRTAVALALAAALGAQSVFAQHYPVRPIRWIVPLPPGATADILTRVFAQKLGEAFGQQVVVDNRPGGVFTVGADEVEQRNRTHHQAARNE
jgi:tripartite-type tricarboxylate transporter receptor subunit TctC